MSELLSVGISYKSAPVELRERLAVPSAHQAATLTALREAAGFGEVMLVSTCNRVEIYGVAAEPKRAQRVALETLAARNAVPADLLQEHAVASETGAAARHIFRVAASLESLVVGEPQILGQVKEAFFSAKQAGHIGPVLDRCLSLAFKSAKRVRTETEIARGGASVPSVAVDLAVNIFGELCDSSVLIVGAGEMAEQSAVHLRAAGVSEMVVVNRSAERGRALADKVQGHYEPWERLDAEFARADVVVTSTGSTLPIIDKAMLKPVMKARRQRPLFFVDIAVPRDVSADVSRLDHVFLYNVDDLQSIVHNNLRSRQGEAARASSLVDEEIAAFSLWMRARGIGPLMGRLQAHGRGIVHNEVERTLAKLPNLSDRDREHVHKMGRAIMQKLLHQPMANVRKASAEPLAGLDGPALADALATLFDLQDARTSCTPSGQAAPSGASSTDEAAALARPEPS